MTVRPTIDQVRTLTDFATSYQWFMRVEQSASGGFPTSEEINLRCISTEIPLLNDTPIETSIRGHKVWQPGIHNYTQSITLTMAESVDMKIMEWIKAWREACYETQTGVHRTKDDVEATIVLTRLNRQDQPIWTYKLIGCFLSQYTQDTLGTENQLLRPTLQINYDYFTDGAGQL